MFVYASQPLYPAGDRAIIGVLMFGQAASAHLLIEVDMSAQRMTVALDGPQLYEWPA